VPFWKNAFPFVRPPKKRDPITVVFILGTRRSGSNWLNLVLGSCSSAYNLGEYGRPWVTPGHVACRLCEADGRPQCTMLHGIETVARKDAFHFAAARSNRRILIDCSRSIEWCREFLGRADIAVRLVHLVRHPCGYVEAEWRREPHLSLDQIFAEWESINLQIDEFLANSGVPHTLACYDDLADVPAEHFPALCRFIGMPWEKAALRYWDFSHHGLGGNGSNSLYLRGRKVINFITADDEFYEDLKHRPLAADCRFRERLPAEFRRRAVIHPYTRSLRERLGKGMWEP
jgi:hypothetical protein